MSVLCWCLFLLGADAASANEVRKAHEVGYDNKNIGENMAWLKKSTLIDEFRYCVL